jgi:hypothetical protein
VAGGAPNEFLGEVWVNEKGLAASKSANPSLFMVASDSRVHELRRYVWIGTARQGRSGCGPQFTRLAHHLLHLGDVLLFRLDRLAGVLLQPDAFVAHEIEELVVSAPRRTLVLEGLEQDLPDLVLVRLDQLADLDRRAT